ncbi:Hypothetical protein D9617_4g003360 [Elsinoe fawcettii]|nr:Hypothetical protein D9617_4g003360 [Elsinoe fawcettii]
MHFPKTSTFAILLPLFLSTLVAAVPMPKEDVPGQFDGAGTEAKDELDAAIPKANKDILVDHENQIDNPLAEFAGLFDGQKRKRETKDVPGQWDGLGTESREELDAAVPKANKDMLVDHENQIDNPLAEFAGLFDGQKRKRETKDVPGQWDGLGTESENELNAAIPKANKDLLVDHENQIDNPLAEFAGLFDGQ